MDKWTEGRTDGRTDARTDGWMDQKDWDARWLDKARFYNDSQFVVYHLSEHLVIKHRKSF